MTEIIKFIYTHPLNKRKKIASICTFIKWQIVSRIWNSSFIFNWIDNSKLIVSKGMTGATGNIYVGLMEYKDMSFLLHYLQKEDLFYDIGANVGVYTVLSSKICGVKTISIEPLPNTYSKLIDNININRLENVIAENIGLSSEKSKLYFTNDKDTMNCVTERNNPSSVEVEVNTLDEITNLYGIPNIMKIDVEGYEENVLDGGIKTLQSENLKVIIIELNGNGKKFGSNDDDIHKKLLDQGFQPFSYDPFIRKLKQLNLYGTHNTIYIREDYLNEVEKTLKNSKPFECNGLII